MFPVRLIFLELITITLSPQSTWGVKFVLCLPLNKIATLEASLPRFWPSASTTTQFLVTVFLLAEIVLKLIVSKIQLFKFSSLKRACKSTIIYFISK